MHFQHGKIMYMKCNFAGTKLNVLLSRKRYHIQSQQEDL